MHNLMAKFQKILENSKQYAGNQVEKFSIWSITDNRLNETEHPLYHMIKCSVGSRIPSNP